MREVADLVAGDQGAAAAASLRPACHPGLEEEAVDDQLPAALEEVEQARRAVRSFDAVVLLHGHARHPAPLGGQRIAGAHQRLLLHQQLPHAASHSCGDTIGGALFIGALRLSVALRPS
jgi:hypothetical protein